MSEGKILAIVGSYRKQGMIDQAVDAVLDGAAEAGARVRKVYLIDQHIEFCRNCRECAQQPGPGRGRCMIEDDLGELLDEVDRVDGLVLASPVNIGDVTAVTRRFFERLMVYAYWPWGQAAPRPRTRAAGKPAVLLTSAAMPVLLARLFTRAMASLRRMAGVLGARPQGELYLGLAARQPQQKLTPREANRARALGRRLGRRLAG